ncbi:MAG: SAM-dependent methyltransferase [Vitreoscilla sp.]|nr:SAM-dependent methyltransferase [Vitreoscilla sp.]
MLLKVGELARRTGLTVRALHHYDSIGLLRPSARSESGYRLYGRADVARLHGIQTLRCMGLSLAEVAKVLDDGSGGVPLPHILSRHIGVLDQEIAQAQALRERLGALRSILAGGGQPELDDWLVSLSMMNTFEQYFSAAELKLVFERWQHCQAEWPPLVQAVRAAMASGVPPDSVAVQPLAGRWMDLSARWMDGDLALLARWGGMLREQPGLPLPGGMDRALLDYIDQAVTLRLDTLTRHLGADGLQRLDKTLTPEWRALGERAERLMAAGTPPQSGGARQLARDWQALLNRVVRHDAGLLTKLLAAHETEPVLQAGAAFTPEVRRYLQQATALDPHATSGRTMGTLLHQEVQPMPTPPTNIVRQGEPSRSALKVAALRAVHQLLDEPLVLPDPVALPLLGAATEAALRDDPYTLNDPLSRGLRGALVARARFVEDELARCVAAGVHQYVVLGAGLDTFAYRNPYQAQGLQVFELDHPGTQRWKQQLLAQARIGLPASLAFVPVDFEHNDLAHALREAGFRADQPACIGWMGVTMYLSPEAVLATLGALVGLAAGSCLCFDYRVPATMLNPVEQVISDVVAQQAAAIGEPWLSSFEPVQLQAQMLALGFSTAESAAPDELNARYFARRKDGLRTGGSVRLMRATL